MRSFPRVLLVHANPFQQVLPVPAYGLERLRTAVSDLAEVEIVDPFLHEQPYALLTGTIERFRPDLIGFGVRVIEDCIVVDGLEGEAVSDVRSLLPEIRELRDRINAAAPDTPLVAGGATFSYLPAELLDHLEIEWGVVGAGEGPFRRLVHLLAEGRPWDGVPGLLRRGEDPVPAATIDFLSRPTVRERWYSHVNGIPVRTRVGCAMSCSYCFTATIDRAHRNNDLERVLDEIEQAAEESRRRGLPPVRLFFADDEFNLPDADHAIAVLAGIERRELSSLVRWRAYFNPTPFPEELARLIAATNGHVSLTVDTASDAVAAANAKPFRRRHLDAAVATITAHGLSVDMGFMFGLPGEDEQTLAESIAFIRGLPPSVDVSYSSGARVYPGTPLAALAAADPARLHGTVELATGAVYASPWPPRRLARHLADAFAGLANVYPIGVGFARASRAQGLAHQAIAAADRARTAALWDEALREAGRGGYRQTPGEAISALVHVALWNDRSDLAAAGLRAQRRLPAAERDASAVRLTVSLALLRPVVWAERLRRRPGREASRTAA